MRIARVAKAGQESFVLSPVPQSKTKNPQRRREDSSAPRIQPSAMQTRLPPGIEGNEI
jgi:hypothetical protein